MSQKLFNEKRGIGGGEGWDPDGDGGRYKMILKMGSVGAISLEFEC